MDLWHYQKSMVEHFCKNSTGTSLHEKCPNLRLFLVRIFLYSVQSVENAEQKKLRIWTIFTQCFFRKMQKNSCSKILYRITTRKFQKKSLNNFCWSSSSLRKHCVKIVRIQSYSGPHFPAFKLNTERYRVSLRIQSKCGKMRTRITSNTNTFYAVRGRCVKLPSKIVHR